MIQKGTISGGMVVKARTAAETAKEAGIPVFIVSGETEGPLAAWALGESVGTRVVLRTKIGPFWQRIEAEHVAYEPGRMFADTMVRGPFARWLHRHIVTPQGPRDCTLTDDIEYELPLGALGRVFGGAFAKRELERLFAYRHEITRHACEADTPTSSE